MAKRKVTVEPAPDEGITRIAIAGFKSISDEQSIDIKPLTILSGANSSGKSSIMQPLLLLKQTLESSFDPGPLLLDGPNVRFTSTDQVLSRVVQGKESDSFQVGVSTQNTTVKMEYQSQPKRGFRIKQMMYKHKDNEIILAPGMTHAQIRDIVYSPIQILNTQLLEHKGIKHKWTINRKRCFVEVELIGKDQFGQFSITRLPFSENLEKYIRVLVHLPALRGNPERTYPMTAVGPTFPGTFQEYTASIIAQWQSEKDKASLTKLSHDLERLGLTSKVSAKRLSDTQVELQVGRLTHGGKVNSRDLVSIADVGVGVSQTLPVLVALIITKPGQLVYIEEPETHLHPRAQSAMAQVLADAAKRGVRVVIETHSQLLLLGIQTLVAEGTLSPDLVKLHWFKRRKNGSTEIISADLNEAGAFGDWPEDFAEVALEAESRYLDAAESQQRVQ